MAGLCLRSRTMRKEQCCTLPPVEFTRNNVLEDLACLDDLTQEYRNCLPSFHAIFIVFFSYNKIKLHARHRIMI